VQRQLAIEVALQAVLGERAVQHGADPLGGAADAITPPAALARAAGRWGR
jgi:hypothetical protein